MTRHLTRAHLARGVAGAVSTLVLCATRHSPSRTTSRCEEIRMTSDPEESVRLQGFGEMTLRTAIGTVMLLAPRERADAAIFRIRDGVRLARARSPISRQMGHHAGG